jgi:hypothetical protein
MILQAVEKWLAQVQTDGLDQSHPNQLSLVQVPLGVQMYQMRMMIHRMVANLRIAA